VGDFVIRAEINSPDVRGDTFDTILNFHLGTCLHVLCEMNCTLTLRAMLSNHELIHFIFPKFFILPTVHHALVTYLDSLRRSVDLCVVRKAALLLDLVYVVCLRVVFASNSLHFYLLLSRRGGRAGPRCGGTQMGLVRWASWAGRGTG
jgi:hypothetical protein